MLAVSKMFILDDKFAGWVIQTKVDDSVNVSNISEKIKNIKITLSGDLSANLPL